MIKANTQTKIENILKSSNGGTLCFENGCTINLTPENGFIFATNPYGIDWMCSSGPTDIKTIAEWVLYWNQPRTETGELICHKDLA